MCNKSNLINTVITSSIILLASCSNQTKAQIIQERQNTISEIHKKHGKVTPPSIDDVPDIDEHDKSPS